MILISQIYEQLNRLTTNQFNRVKASVQIYVQHYSNIYAVESIYGWTYNYAYIDVYVFPPDKIVKNLWRLKSHPSNKNCK